ncbi:MAG TPA: AAA family ATPase [Chitinophagaceae bacterium]|nr:AAA family ATPase [Chitinophagaceae bacterium]
MKVLVLGPSGSGKTYIARALQRAGINAFDDGDIPGLSAWYNRQGQKVPQPATAQQALDNHYSFLWSKNVLAELLSRFPEVYVFGGSGNVFDMLPLFDKVYFLKIDPALQKERIRNAKDRDAKMDFNEDELVIWGGWFEQEAQKRDITFIDASLTPEEIFEVIKGQ